MVGYNFYPIGNPYLKEFDCMFENVRKLLQNEIIDVLKTASCDSTIIKIAISHIILKFPYLDNLSHALLQYKNSTRRDFLRILS